MKTIIHELCSWTRAWITAEPSHRTTIMETKPTFKQLMQHSYLKYAPKKRAFSFFTIDSHSEMRQKPHTHTHTQSIMNECMRMFVEDMCCICPLHTAVSLCKNDWQMGVLHHPLSECDNPYVLTKHTLSYFRTQEEEHTNTLTMRATHSHAHLNHRHTHLFPSLPQDLRFRGRFCIFLKAGVHSKPHLSTSQSLQEPWKMTLKIQSCWHTAGSLLQENRHLPVSRWKVMQGSRDCCLCIRVFYTPTVR